MIAGVTVEPGDVVVADATGVVLVPRARAAQVLDLATAVQERERAIAADLRAGCHSPKPCTMPDSPDSTRSPVDRCDHYHREMAALPTAAVSDALDALGLPGALHGIGPLTDTARAVGPAFTVRFEPITDEPGTVGDFLDDVPAGAVVVIDNAGRTDCTVWGGIMTTLATAKGVAGAVVHGVCRDVATAFALGYPMFSAGRFMRTGKDRVRCVAGSTLARARAELGYHTLQSRTP